MINKVIGTIVLALALCGCNSTEHVYHKSYKRIQPDGLRAHNLKHIRYQVRPEELLEIQPRIRKIMNEKPYSRNSKEVQIMYSKPGMSHVDHFIPYARDLYESPQSVDHIKWTFDHGQVVEVVSVEDGVSHLKQRLWYAGGNPILSVAYDESEQAVWYVWANYNEGRPHRLLHFTRKSHDPTRFFVDHTTIFDYSDFGLAKNKYVFSNLDGKLQSFYFDVHGIEASYYKRGIEALADSTENQTYVHPRVYPLWNKYPTPNHRIYGLGEIYPGETLPKEFVPAKGCSPVRYDDIHEFTTQVDQTEVGKIWRKFKDNFKVNNMSGTLKTVRYYPTSLPVYHYGTELSERMTNHPADPENHWKFIYVDDTLRKLYHVKDGKERLVEKCWVRPDGQAYAKAWFDNLGSGYITSVYWADFKEDLVRRVVNLSLAPRDHARPYLSTVHLFDYSSTGLLRTQYSFWGRGSKLQSVDLDIHGIHLDYWPRNNQISDWNQRFEDPWTQRLPSEGHHTFRFPYQFKYQRR